MLKNKSQTGVFSIEMAFVLLGMCGSLCFCFDLGYQQIRKSQLERISYSLVSVLKERALFFDKRESANSNDVRKLHTIGTKLLGAKKEDVAVVINQRVAGQKGTHLKYPASLSCAPKQKLSKSFDVTLEKSGKYAPVYQVTVCQRIPAWFERIIGEEADKNDRIIQAQSSFLGR